MADLKPCPFPHEVIRGVYLDVDTEDFLIARGACSDCGCAGPCVSLADSDGITATETAEVIRLWNTRASLEATPLMECVEQWQPIETAPKGERILVFIPEDVEATTGPIHPAIHAKTSNGHSWFIGHRFGFDCDKPTHWRPLPEPPAALAKVEPRL